MAASGKRVRCRTLLGVVAATIIPCLVVKQFMTNLKLPVHMTAGTYYYNNYYFSQQRRQLVGQKQQEQQRLVTKNHEENLSSTIDDEIMTSSSSTATVIGIAVGYKIDVYERFVGTLRKTGFDGNIILGVDDNAMTDDVRRYLQHRNVNTKSLKWIPCTYRHNETDTVDIHGKSCAGYAENLYPDVNLGWSRHKIYYDWLQECKTCTGPVLTSDVRDTFFQLNPFGTDSSNIEGIQVFEELKYKGEGDGHSTFHWLTHPAIHQCKNITIQQTMLCAGTTVGTRTAMMQYLKTFHDEIEEWNNGSKDCHDAIHKYGGGDQALHNYLYYSGKLPYATAIPNREGMVNTLGAVSEYLVGHELSGSQRKTLRKEGRFPDANGSQWIGKQYNIVDEEGYFTQFDGSRSRVVHQYDRLSQWVWGNIPQKHDWFRDPILDTV